MTMTTFTTTTRRRCRWHGNGGANYHVSITKFNDDRKISIPYRDCHLCAVLRPPAVAIPRIFFCTTRILIRRLAVLIDPVLARSQPHVIPLAIGRGDPSQFFLSYASQHPTKIVKFTIDPIYMGIFGFIFNFPVPYRNWYFTRFITARHKTVLPLMLYHWPSTVTIPRTILLWNEDSIVSTKKLHPIIALAERCHRQRQSLAIFYYSTRIRIHKSVAPSNLFPIPCLDW